MTIKNRINSIVSRADALNITLGQLCNEVDGVEYAKVWSWHKRNHQPRYDDANDTLSSLEAELTNLENKMRDYLESLGGACEAAE